MSKDRSPIFTTAWRNIKRSGWRAYAIIFMMTITYLILGILLTVMFTSQSLADFFTQKPEVIGFFNDDVPEEKILETKKQLETFEYVVEVRYVSKEEAMASFLEKNKDNQEVVEAITANVFPAHLNVKSKSLDDIKQVVAYFENNDSVLEVSSSEDVIPTLEKVVSSIQIFGLALLIVFTISTVFIIFLGIGITVYSQKEEIIVMKLVGATNWFVRTPYLLQSLFYSLVATVISSIILGVILSIYYNNGLKWLVQDTSSVVLKPEAILVGVAIMIVFGIFLATSSALFATRRYIDY